MKLRNKKTGEITDLAKRGLLKSDNDNHIIVYPEGALKYYAYNSLAELNEEWEDYKPKEPLIKDEKIRKAVRAWAEANDIDSCFYGDKKVKFNSSEHQFTWIDTSIEFDEIIGLENLKNREKYTIAELCGKVEE